MHRVRINWTGFPGGPGISTLYGTESTAAPASSSNCLTDISNQVPMDVSWNIPSSGDTIDPITGLITGGWSGGTPTPGTGGGTGVYAAPVGCMIKWSTGQVRSGRRVKGRTFLVPLVGTAFDTAGNVEPGAIGTIADGAAALVTALAPNFFVWQRPRKASNAWTDVHGLLHPAKVARVGESIAITSSSVPTKAVVLRSRRD